MTGVQTIYEGSVDVEDSKSIIERKFAKQRNARIIKAKSDACMKYILYTFEQALDQLYSIALKEKGRRKRNGIKNPEWLEYLGIIDTCHA